MSLPDQIRAKEDRLVELMLILLNLFHLGLIDKTRYLELGANLVRGAAEDVRSLVDYGAKRRGFPTSDAAAIALLLQRVQGDLSQQISDLDAGAPPEEIKIRVQQTALHTVWAAYSESMKSIAGKVGARLRWVTMADEMVCLECAPRHMQVYEPSQLPGIPPLHPNCRCWVEWVLS